VGGDWLSENVKRRLSCERNMKYVFVWRKGIQTSAWAWKEWRTRSFGFILFAKDSEVQEVAKDSEVQEVAKDSEVQEVAKDSEVQEVAKDSEVQEVVMVWSCFLAEPKNT